MNQSFDLSDRTNMFYWQTNRKISPQQTKDIFLDRRYTVNKKDTKKAVEFGLKQIGRTGNAAQVKTLDKPIEFGSVNNVMPVTLQDNSQVIVRMHPYHVENGYFSVEKAATQEASEQGVPTYETLFIGDAMDQFDFDFMIMTKSPGRTIHADQPLEKSLELNLTRQTGRYAALIHKVKPQGFGFFLNHIAKENNELQGQYQSFQDHVYAGLEEDLKFLVDHQVFSKKQRQAIEQIFKNHQSLMNIEQGVLIHNDIADWNQLYNDSKVAAMLDWDECCSGDPVMEFSAYSLFYGDDRMQAFKEGYQEISSLPDNFDEKFHLFTLRYLISKMHLRKKRLLVVESTFLEKRIARAMEVMQEEFDYFEV